MWPLRAALALAAALSLGVGTARADSSDVAALVTAAAVAHHVNPAWMVRVAICESSLNPFAVSADGSNLGLFQLNRRGELLAFYARGYDNPFDPAQSANFAAERFSEGAARAWTCA